MMSATCNEINMILSGRHEEFLALPQLLHNAGFPTCWKTFAKRVMNWHKDINIHNVDWDYFVKCYEACRGTSW